MLFLKLLALLNNLFSNLFTGWTKEEVVDEPKKNVIEEMPTLALTTKNTEQAMINILSHADMFGQMTYRQKMCMGSLIRKNGSFPKVFRKRLWALCCAVEVAKRNHPNYFSSRK